MWTKDKLNRKKFADFLCTLIKNSDKYKRTTEEEAYVIALDSSWGTGKSWFLEMFEHYLEETEREHGIRVIHYSAWANDFWDNAFLPLLYVLYKQDMLKVDALGEKGKGYVRNIWKLAAYLGKEVGLKKVETVFGEEVVNALRNSLDGTEEHFELGIDGIFEDYEDFCEAYGAVRKMLTDYLEKLGENGKIIIVVDELDRCRPDFAAQTLEVVKHLFNINGLVFLFAVDMEQMGCVIRGIYGESLDARSYLNRMFHYVTHLPAPDSAQYIRLLYEEKLSNFESVHQRAEHRNLFANFTGRLAVGFGLSLRELDTIWKNYLVLYDYKLKNYLRTEAHLLYVTFLVLKYKMPDWERCLEERGYHALEGLAEMGSCMGVLDKESPLRGAFSHRVDSRLCHVKGWAYAEYSGIVEKAHGQLKETDAGMLDVDGQAVTINSSTCFAGILYPPDFQRWNQVKNQSLVEYMREQLELFEFSGE